GGSQRVDDLGRRDQQVAFAQEATELDHVALEVRMRGAHKKLGYDLRRVLKYPPDHWVASPGLPIHSGYFIEDLRELPLGRWEARGCDAAFIQLEGQQGITETRVSEVPPRAVLPPVRLAFDEVVYVVQGRGATTIWRSGGERKSFEWGENSMFLLPRHHFHQFSNTHGTRPARLPHY